MHLNFNNTHWIRSECWQIFDSAAPYVNWNDEKKVKTNHHSALSRLKSISRSFPRTEISQTSCLESSRMFISQLFWSKCYNYFLISVCIRVYCVSTFKSGRDLNGLNENNLYYPFECRTWHFVRISDDWILFAFAMSVPLFIANIFAVSNCLRVHPYDTIPTDLFAIRCRLCIFEMFAIICMQTNCIEMHRHPKWGLQTQSACNDDTLLKFFLFLKVF